MAGKGAGKKRNRAAQSEQHGYQQQPKDAAEKESGKRGRAYLKNGETKQRLVEKLRQLRQRSQDKEKNQPAR